jgi:hypothetical protein
MVHPVFRGKIKALVFVACVIFLAYYVWRDINLPRRAALDNLPDIAVQNLQFRRTIKNRHWSVQAATAEHDSGRIRAKDIAVDVRELDSSRAATVYAKSGEFEQDRNFLELRSLDGSISFENGSIDLAAPAASYYASDDIWTFTEGLELSGDGVMIRGRAATISPPGIFSIEKGAYVRWRVE